MWRRALTVVLAGMLWAMGSPGAGAFAQNGTSVDLAPGVEAGREFRFRVRSETKQDLRSPLLTQSFEAAQDLTVLVKVTSSDAAGMRVELTHEHMRIRLKTDAMDETWDSDQPEGADGESRLAQVARPLIGKPVVIRLDGRGEIEKVEGLDALAPGGIDGVLFRQLFSEDAFRSMYHMVFRVKEPPAEASRGDQWRLLDDGSKGLVRLSREYHLTLESVSGEEARIRIRGISGRENDTGAPGMTAQEYELEGWCEWDTAQRILRSLESTERAVFGDGADLKVEVRSETRVERIPG